MNKLLLTALTLTASLFATDIPEAKVQMHKFNKSVELNAQVIQLSNAQQSITSLVAGHLEKYYVKPAQKVKQGQKIALIESIVVSKMSADYIALKKQLNAAEKNYKSVENLYKKGMTSMQELNNQEIKRSKINAQLTALESQLETLGINVDKLTKATPNFVLYAHSGGTVSRLLKPLHSSVSVSEPVLTIVKKQAYYIKSYLPLEYATKVKLGDKIVVEYAGENIITHITQILPKIDETTQRVQVLSSVDEKVNDLFLNTYLESTLYFGDAKEYTAVKKSALSFFNNEWVVFVPKEAEKDEVPYTLVVVKIITEDESYVAIEGLNLGEEYVSAKSYYVKSALLKDSLGDGD